MPKLHIAFQDGFENDTAVVHIDGEEVVRKENLKTRLQIGLAGSADLEIEPGMIELKTMVPSRNISKSVRIDATKPVYLGISISWGDLTYKIAGEPFGYV
jgi:hypothetical protein